MNAITRWDPDGAGPKPELIVVAGRFSLLGNTSASGIAAWNPATDDWFWLDGGVNTTGTVLTGLSGGQGTIYALAATPDGRLFAGGVFWSIGGVITNNIAQFDGKQWKPVLAGTKEGSTYAVTSLLALPNGDVIAGGSFDLIGTTNASGPFSYGVARWDGVAWHQYGSGFGPQSVGTGGGARCLTIDHNGTLYAGGPLNGNQPRLLAKWTGTDWISIPGAPSGITSIVPHPDGGVVVRGTFGTIGGNPVPQMARWDGASWSTIPSAPELTITATTSITSLDGGSFAALVNSRQPARWDGARLVAWGAISPMNTSSSDPPNPILALPSGDFILGIHGGFNIGTPDRYDGLALRRNNAWRPLTDLAKVGPNSNVSAMVPMSDGRVLVSGRVFDGVIWSAGPAIPIVPHVAITAPNGDIIAARSGILNSTGAVGRWNGTAWTNFGVGPNGLISCIAVLPNQDVVVGGSFSTAGGKAANNLARWNGTEWFPIGVGTNGPVYALAVLPDGDLVVGGGFNVVGANGAGQGIMRFRNNIAYTMGAGIGPSAIVRAMCFNPAGELLAAGQFAKESGDKADKVAKWTGSAWVPITDAPAPRGTVNSMTTDAWGRVLVGGFFQGATAGESNCVARFDGVAWRAMGNGLDGNVTTLAWSPTLGVLAGGSFSRSGDSLTPFFARFACLPNACTSDFDTDGLVTGADFDAFATAFDGGGVTADLNGDRSLTFEDFDVFVGAFETGC